MLAVLLGVVAMAGSPDPAEVDQVLDALHRAATDADAETYFGLYADDAVFIGTDPAERWDLPAFRDFAAPHFEEAPAWAYTPVEREVHFGPKGRSAWFYETLSHERYGAVRGSGALRLQGGEWRITQYVLSFPVPNDRARDVIAIVHGQPASTLPPPFTAAHIRSAYQPGYTSLHRITEGEAVLARRMRVVSADAESVTMEGITLLWGQEEGPAPQTMTATWEELRDHAAFPAATTTWTDEVEVEVPAGRFLTREYVVTGIDRSVTHYFFAWDAAGPPVKMVREAGGEVVMTMELYEHTPVGPAGK